ncbi:hypothetical protein [Fulvivirga sp.]|uniref:hypothetical protein n=1 Tax=Fulvivirga sp. TaxID=1931237 RepID=UPI0032EE2777
MWNRIRLFLIRLLTSKEDEIEVIEPIKNNPSEVIGLSNRPGIDCPECGTRILTTIDMILSRVPIQCVKCGLQLNIQQEESKPALDSLRKLDGAIKEAEKVSK